MTVFTVTRFFLYPIIIVADFIQTNFTRYFTPMNIGPVNDPKWSRLIRGFFSKKDFVLDFGCGVGFFCKLFNHKNYIGLDINNNFIQIAKERNKKYIFSNFDELKIKDYKSKINAVLINNVIHHLSKNNVKKTFKLIKTNSKRNTKIMLIEPVLPKNFFSIVFFLKALDIGNYMKDKEGYLKVLKPYIKINKVYKTKLGIAEVLVIHSNIK